MKRAFATLFAITLAAGLLGPGRTEPARAAAAAKKTPDPCASKPSKWQRLQCHEFNASAPGDEYFGRMKMSYLGIDNTFHDETVRAGPYTTDPAIIGKVRFADDALTAWMRKYPSDPQLARSVFLAAEVYERIYTPEAQQKAWNYLQLLTARFPATYFGKLAKKELAIGFTEHYFAEAQPCPTPLPTLPPGVRATPTPLPTIAPLPSPTPTPAPGQPKVQVIVPSCVPPVTPSPPTPVPVMPIAPAVTSPNAPVIPPSTAPAVTSTSTPQPAPPARRT